MVYKSFELIRSAQMSRSTAVLFDLRTTMAGTVATGSLLAWAGKLVVMKLMPIIGMVM